MHAEHGLMFEDARQHGRAAYYYKLAILLGCQTSQTELDYNVDSVLGGIAEAYDGEWQDTGALSCLLHATALHHVVLSYYEICQGKKWLCPASELGKHHDEESWGFHPIATWMPLKNGKVLQARPRYASV